MPPSDTSTGSLKRSFTALGGLVYTPPFAGSVLSSVACADAGAATATTSATTIAPSATKRRITTPAGVVADRAPDGGARRP